MLTTALSIAALIALEISSGAQAQAQSGRNFWIGRWYVDNASVCRGKAGETEGLLVYTAKEFFGYENRCTITKVTPRRSGVALSMRCRGEGRSTRHMEIVEEYNGGLRRNIEVGRRLEAYDYRRCPG